jgi:uncharacterized protein (UPF0548 family)
MTGLSYAEVGATRYDELPSGYRHVRRQVRLGTGERVFRAVGDAVLGFDLQRRVGLRPVASAPRAAEGVVVTTRLGLGPLALPLPCQVIWLREDDEQIGFGYGTLTGHGEAGEEAFVVHRDPDGVVWLDIRAFSRPALWFARLAGPIATAMQDVVTARYVRAAQAVAASAAA